MYVYVVGANDIPVDCSGYYEHIMLIVAKDKNEALEFAKERDMKTFKGLYNDPEWKDMEFEVIQQITAVEGIIYDTYVSDYDHECPMIYIQKITNGEG